MKIPLLLMAFSAVSSVAQEWPRFRGPNGAGVSKTEIPAKWTKANFSWSMELPASGHGSPVVAGKNVFVLCGDETSGTRIPLCVDADSGHIRWQVSVKAARNKHHKFNSVASTTPACDAERVYFSWGTSDDLTLAAYDHAGKHEWSANLGPSIGGHGFGASPIVHRGLVIINKDQDADGEWVAVDAKTGTVAWRLARRSKRISYSCAVAYKDQLVLNNWQHGISGINPRDGSLLWEKSVYDIETKELVASLDDGTERTNFQIQDNIALAYCRKFDCLVSGNQAGHVTIINADDFTRSIVINGQSCGDPAWAMTPVDGAIRSISVSPDQQYVAIGQQRGKIRLIETALMHRDIISYTFEPHHDLATVGAHLLL